MEDKNKHGGSPAEGERREAPDTKSLDFSLEERGMMLAPEIPVPTNQVDTGNMPGADAAPAGGDTGGGNAGVGEGASSGSGDGDAGE